MAASSLKKGWLTSLIPATAAHASSISRSINIRPINYLKVPQLSFIHTVRKKAKKARGEAKVISPAVDVHGNVVRTSVAISKQDSSTAVTELSKDISALTLYAPSEGQLGESRIIHSSISKTEFNVQSLDTTSTILDTHQQPQHGPIHFHRRPHKTVHNHNVLSNPSPLTSESRKYAIPKPHSHATQPLTVKVDPRAHIRPSTPEPISPTTIKNRLRSLFDHEEIHAEWAERERKNPFPYLDQNYGWNRAMCAGKMYFHTEWTPFNNDDTLNGALEEMLYIKRCFARFSLWAQREVMEFDEEDLSGENGWGEVFDVVFKGEGVGLCWARIPGSWHAIKPGLLTCCRSVSFYDEVLDWTEGIRERVRKWRAQNQGWRAHQALSSKRRFKTLWTGHQDQERVQRTRLGWKETSQSDGVDPTVKRIRLRRREPEKIATEQWRARRREQEKKAGRWLDGTIRQDRMWAEFHWVLNVDDPREHVWPRYRYYYRNGVRCWYRI
ncbi:hypothetical protein IFR04_011598 [Cadophora malorum]|uniref:Uncharacterized protein n=1 Tax=Cadophora malorum TaxID=108018 RepID=A0A8H7T994_9HELO|nr:hypothetical protein IFR04_011598 [Cadophora malorum]